jgi:hypothetical protein
MRDGYSVLVERSRGNKSRVQKVDGRMVDGRMHWVEA